VDPAFKTPNCRLDRIRVDAVTGAPRIVSVRLIRSGAWQHDISATAEDADGDGIAESVVVGPDATQWPAPRPPRFLEVVPDMFDVSGSPLRVDAFRDGVRALYVDDGNTPGETIVVRDLSQQGAILGSATARAPLAVVEIPVPGGLQGGHLLEAECVSTGKKMLEFVPYRAAHGRQERHPEFPLDSRDIDGDGLNDRVGEFDGGALLYVGLSDAAGNVTATHLLLVPDTTEPSDDKANQLQRIAGAPAPGVAFGGYDGDGDGANDDAVIVTEAPGGLATIHFGIDVLAEGTGVWNAVRVTGSENLDVPTYVIGDHDGDADIDMVLSFYDPASGNYIPVMYVWDSVESTFVPTDRPVLTVDKTVFSASEPVTPWFTCRMGTDNEFGYRLFLSRNGTTSDFLREDVQFPLELDEFKALATEGGGSPYVVDFAGTFDGGESCGELRIPAGDLAPGDVLHAVFGVYSEGDPRSVAVSNPVQIRIVE